jgi:Predicted DNA-binding proteins
MMPWRGRRRGRRWISISPTSISFGPLGRPPSGKVFIFLSELEALRLVDLENLTQKRRPKGWGYQERRFGQIYRGEGQKLLMQL